MIKKFHVRTEILTSHGAVRTEELRIVMPENIHYIWQ